MDDYPGGNIFLLELNLASVIMTLKPTPAVI